MSCFYKLTFGLQHVRLKEKNQANKMTGGGGGWEVGVGGGGVDHLLHKSGDPSSGSRTHLAVPRIDHKALL